MNLRIIQIQALIYLLVVSPAFSQRYSLEYCLDKATEISPLTRQQLYYETLEEMTEKNISNAYLPAFFFNGQASWQSDVFSFPSNPVLESPLIPKEQFRLTLDLNQKIYDGGLTKNQKIAETAKLQSDRQSVEIDLYDIKSTITKLYFAALIYQENIKIFNTLLAELQEQYRLVESRVKNGVLLKSASNEFRKQILTTEQNMLSASLEQEAILQMLSKWIEEDMTSAKFLEIPQAQSGLNQYEVKRPEVKLLESQNLYFESMKNLSSVKRRPNIWAVAQAGVGQPNAYNFLEVDVSDFYYVGVRLSWHVFDYGNVKRERSMFEANQSIINAKKEHLVDNIDIQLTKELSEVNKLKELIEKDTEIVDLQSEIVESAFSQLSNGTITSTEYLSQLSSRTHLQLNRQIHLIQLRQAEYNCLDISGNL